MSYLVLARKWRPKTFEQVIGQQHVLRALINGLDQDRLHHAFLFAGTRGVGKTTLARILAKSLNCETGVSSTPCGVCQSCVEVDSGRFVDLIEVDAASRTKVDDTRELLDNVQYAPSRGRYKVYLIDEVHMLSTSSFNALLKTLEEPPPHVKFLLATTDPQKLPVTILSRCLQFNLRRLNVTQISDHLAMILAEEKIAFEPSALQQIAYAADGSMRDALSLMDQAIGFCGGGITAEQIHQMLGNVSHAQLLSILVAIGQQQGTVLLQQAAELVALGREPQVMLDGLLQLLQRIATLQMIPDLENPDPLDETILNELSVQFSPETVQLLYQIALHGKRDLPYAADPQSGFEMTLLRMLSFQPQTLALSSPAPEMETPVKKSPRAAQAAPDTAALSAETQAQSPVAIATQADSSPSSTVTPTTPPVIEDDIQQSPAPPYTTAATSKADDTAVPLSLENWTQVIAELKLSALARQLADNCAFVRAEQQKVYLMHAKELAHLATPRAKERLELAINKHLQTSLQLIFETASDEQLTGTQTLAAERAQDQSDKIQMAIDAIHNDPVVEVIKNTFNARIIDNTIKPLN